MCLLPFRDPHLVSCCGKKYCAPCIGRVKEAGQPCPVCKQDFISLLDRDYQRRVLNLKVVCSRKKNGCQWVGELSQLDHHEREECGWAVVECSYQCGAHLPRRLMAEHKHDECSQRPMDIKLEWFMKSMETKLTTERERHVREVAAVREEFKNTLTEERETHNMEMEELKQLLAEQKRETESKMAEQRKETDSRRWLNRRGSQEHGQQNHTRSGRGEQDSVSGTAIFTHEINLDLHAHVQDWILLTSPTQASCSTEKTSNTIILVKSVHLFMRSRRHLPLIYFPLTHLSVIMVPNYSGSAWWHMHRHQVIWFLYCMYWIWNCALSDKSWMILMHNNNCYKGCALALAVGFIVCVMTIIIIICIIKHD